MRSIRRQLTRNLLGTSLALLLGGLGAIYAAAHFALLHQFDQALRAKAQAISTLTVNDGGDVRLNFTDEFMRGFDDDSRRDFFTLWREDGRQIAKSESLRRRELTLPQERWRGTRYWNLKLPNGRPGRAVGYTFEPERTNGTRRDVKVQLVVASDRRDLNETLLQLLGVGGAAGLLLLGTTLIVVPRVLRRGLRPLDELGARAARIDAAALADRFPVDGLPAELKPIAGRLNELLGRIEASFERERRFSADLAHELRTPLAELRSMMETALKWPETREATQDRETLAIALQMEALVTTMLTLARGEKGMLAARLEPVAMTSLVEAAWRPCAARAGARGLEVELDLQEVRANADPGLLRSVLGNLFDNAVEYTAPGGKISLRLRDEGGRGLLEVANPTESLTPADSGRLFERFWRKEEARSGGRHFGLGLSLARLCAQAMGWTLTGTVDAGGIVRFSLVFPLEAGGNTVPPAGAMAVGERRDPRDAQSTLPPQVIK